MLWDKLCKIAEKNDIKGMQNLSGLLRKTKLFVFDQISTDFLPKKQEETIKEEMSDFRLPYPVVAVEDPQGVVVVADIKKDQVGFEFQRFFLDFILCHEKNHLVMGFGKMKIGSCGKLEIYTSSHVVNAFRGSKRIELFDSKYTNGSMSDYDFNDPKECAKRPAELTEIFKSASQNFSTGLQELFYLMQPKNFILQTTPRKVRDPLKSPKIPRSHERPTYTLLKPGEIRRRMGIAVPPGKGGAKTPHERAGHRRTLRHDRFGKNKGKKIWVKHSWVGPSEARVGNKFYKVILDNPEENQMAAPTELLSKRN